MPQNKKLSDKQFLTILRENSGLYTPTAKSIKKVLNIEISRQAVRAKALNFHDELYDIQEENLDIAEEGLHSLMKSDDGERVRVSRLPNWKPSGTKRRPFPPRLAVSDPSES